MYYSGRIINAYNSIGWYGIQIDESNSSPDVTRVASDMTLHASLPIQNQMKGCLLNDNGTVNYYLNSTDWTKKADGNASKLDGTDGMVMVEIPEFYYLYVLVSAGVHQIRISQYPLTNYTKVPKHYVSAFEAAINRTAPLKLWSIINTSTEYRGGNNTSAWDAGSNSLLGKPVTNINRTNFRTYAGNRGTGWHLHGYTEYNWLWWLFVIEYATRNSQKAVNANLTAQGYKQGGLGDGVSTANGTEWNNFNSYNPFINCGATNSLANGTGQILVTVNDFGGAGVNGSFNVPRYRGIENPFGHIWKIIDGINLEVQSAGSGGKTNIWINNTPSQWQDNNYTNYTNIGNMAQGGNGYEKYALLGSTASFLPTDTTGTVATYYCDYVYNAIPGSGVALRMLLVGGSAATGTFAGLVESDAGSAPSIAKTYYGSRLCFLAA